MTIVRLCLESLKKKREEKKEKDEDFKILEAQFVKLDRF